jgi:hypothetical protein
VDDELSSSAEGNGSFEGQPICLFLSTRITYFYIQASFLRRWLNSLPAMDRSGCTLAIHNLPDWVDENYLYQLFMPTRSVVSVKVSRLRTAGGGKMAYMTMNSHENAEGCLQAYNGTMPPNVQLRLEMSWATHALPMFEGAPGCACLSVFSTPFNPLASRSLQNARWWTGRPC